MILNDLSAITQDDDVFVTTGVDDVYTAAGGVYGFAAIADDVSLPTGVIDDIFTVTGDFCDCRYCGKRGLRFRDLERL